MGLDIKIPIGVMFSIFGAILTIHGLVTASNVEMYSLSQGININIWSGAGMLVFGAFMLVLSVITKRKAK